MICSIEVVALLGILKQKCLKSSQKYGRIELRLNWRLESEDTFLFLTMIRWRCFLAKIMQIEKVQPMPRKNCPWLRKEITNNMIDSFDVVDSSHQSFEALLSSETPSMCNTSKDVKRKESMMDLP